MTFHHTYGIPYIPGQAIKGIVRNYITCEYFNFDEIEALKCENFKRIFGIENEKDSKDLYKGDVIFFDAFPINEKINIKKDIMNVHYKGYYNFKKNNGEINPPSDTETPIPIYFLTVEDATFEFFLAYNEEIEPTINDNNIFELLKEALNKFGIGAKTGVGYGYFEDNEE